MRDVLNGIAESGTVSASDLAAIRRCVFSDGSVSRDELTAVAAVAPDVNEPCAAWSRLVVEMCEDHFLLQNAPSGYFTPDGEKLAAELFASAGNRGCRTLTEALVHLLYKCRSAPVELADIAMARIEQDVLADGRVCAGDAALTRKLLYAQGSRNGLGICRQEAELLFRLNDYSFSAENDPDWIDLFCKGVGCHLMVQHGWVAPTRERALEREKWLEDTSVNPASFLARGLAGVFGAFGRRDREFLWVERNERFEREATEAAAITNEEVEWLAERIGHHGKVCDAEKALISYISSLSEMDLSSRLGCTSDEAWSGARIGAA